MHSEFLRYMSTTVIVNDFVSGNPDGVPTYSTNSVTHYARVEHNSHYVVDRNGKQVVSRARIMIGDSVDSTGLPTLTATDQLTWNGSTQVIQTVDTFNTSLANHVVAHVK